jgi:mRNA-degrading endonuclease RelE of RelBE toxin-antitoxin system
MSFEIITSDYFDAEVKKLAKRYRDFKEDLKAFRKEIVENPQLGVEIAPNVRKIRMRISAKGKGKSGGARVITFNAFVSKQEGRIYLLLIYDKSDASNIKMNVVKKIIKEIGE